MREIEVAVINAGTALSDAEVASVFTALRIQVQRDFTPVWGATARLVFIPRGQPPPPQAWWLAVLDSTDRPGASGYHDVTPAGLPIGKAFVEDDATAGVPWSTTASHELLEMLGDPYINLAVFVEWRRAGIRLFAREVCDPCEALPYSYDIAGVRVSDFIFPSWFDPSPEPGTVFDQTGSIQRPFELLPGGFISALDVAMGTVWQPVFAATGDPTGAPRRCVHTRTDSRLQEAYTVATAADLDAVPLRGADQPGT